MQKEHEFYIDDIRLPITPEAISTKIKNKNEVINLLNGEEYNLLKKAGLTEFEFKFRLPHTEYPSVSAFTSVDSVLSSLEKLKTAEGKEKKVFEFIIIRHTEGLVNSINKSVTLEEYSIEETAKNAGDLIVSVKLKQYLELKTKKLNVKAEGKEVDIKKPLKATVEVVKQLPRTPLMNVVVGTGMTLPIIAKKYLGDSSKWRYLAKINNIKNPNRLKDGQVIKLV